MNDNDGIEDDSIKTKEEGEKKIEIEKKWSAIVVVVVVTIFKRTTTKNF